MNRSLIFALSIATLFTTCKSREVKDEPPKKPTTFATLDSLTKNTAWPKELMVTPFTAADITPSPACLAVAATGEVYVGVDMVGSLGKEPGKGMIITLIDSNDDGVVDQHIEYAAVDNPRGIISMGDKLFVLHTIFSKERLATGMDLVVFEDRNRDGIADGPPTPLVQHMSNPNFLQSRGTDHATNGIRLAIDGWIYIAVGDFGFHNALGSDGKQLTMLGGGIVRVRPDGTGMEIYSHGLRNIYDLAIDPYMNIFTRDNTNDGGGWNIRFSHQLQSGEYGYPLLFKHFTEEIIPAMADLGGGSGTGALFMDEPSWPEKFNQVPMMADWGRNELFIHRVTVSGGSFKQEQEEFLTIPQITDLDVDGSGRLYLSAWDNAGYSGDSSRGFVLRAVPKNWNYKPFPDLKKLSLTELQTLLKSSSAVARLAAQQELLTKADKGASYAWENATNKKLPVFARVAGIFTYAQIKGREGIKQLLLLTADEAVREFALRALADRKDFIKEVPVAPFLLGIRDTLSPRVQIAAIIGMGRIGDPDETSQALLDIPVPASFQSPPRGEEGPHAIPNTGLIPAHLAVRALVAISATDACIRAIGGKDNQLALWALRYMQNEKAASGLIAAHSQFNDTALKKEILGTIARLYHEETAYDGTWWWSTRPDTHGPYARPVEWSGSAKIKTFLLAEWNKANASGKKYFADLNGSLRLGFKEFGGEDASAEETETKVDFEKIKSKKGQIGQSSIEDILLAMDKLEGDPVTGKGLFVQQGCIACHSIKKGETLKGPFMGQIGSIMNRKQIAESILKPDASISQGFATVVITTNDGKKVTGFVTGESGGELTIRDIAGTAHKLNTKEIRERKELPTSIMPTGLANALSYEEFASLITYLSQQKN